MAFKNKLCFIFGPDLDNILEKAADRKKVFLKTKLVQKRNLFFVTDREVMKMGEAKGRPVGGVTLREVEVGTSTLTLARMRPPNNDGTRLGASLKIFAPSPSPRRDLL